VTHLLSDNFNTFALKNPVAVVTVIRPQSHMRMENSRPENTQKNGYVL